MTSSCSVSGQYYQTIGRSSVIFSVNTANITLGKHTMAVSIYRRGHSTYVPIARASTTYVVTGECAEIHCNKILGAFVVSLLKERIHHKHNLACKECIA